MFILSALCVLLPLAAALDTCDDDKAQAFLSKAQLQGDLLDNFDGKKFWFVASGKAGSDSKVKSGQVTFGSVDDDEVDVSFVYRDASGATTQSSSTTYSLDDDRVLAQDGDVALYFFRCSSNLIGAYRCQTDDDAGASGPKYYVWAAWNKSDADVKAEFSSCVKEFTKVDSSAAFLRRVHP